MEKEIIQNDGVIEAAEEVVEKASGNQFMTGFGVGIAVVIIGGIAYKFAIKPLIAKMKDGSQNTTVEVADDEIPQKDVF